MSQFQIQSFGYHQISFHDIENPAYSAAAHILDSFETDLKSEVVKNEGGSSPVPFNCAAGRMSGEITTTVKGVTKELIRFFTPWKATSEVETESGESGGSVTTLTNLVNSSVQNATTGIASVALQSGASSSLAPGKYKVVATAATTVDLYVDFDGAGNITYQDNSLKAVSSLVIASGATTNSLGLTFTGGSGTIAMTAGDIAVFEVLPVSDYLLITKFGETGGYHREFLLRAYSETSIKSYKIFEAYRCKAFGTLSASNMNKEFSTWELTLQVLQPNSAALEMAQAFNSTVGTEFGREYFINKS